MPTGNALDLVGLRPDGTGIAAGPRSVYLSYDGGTWQLEREYSLSSDDSDLRVIRRSPSGALYLVNWYGTRFLRDIAGSQTEVALPVAPLFGVFGPQYDVWVRGATRDSVYLLYWDPANSTLQVSLRQAEGSWRNFAAPNQSSSQRWIWYDVPGNFNITPDGWAIATGRDRRAGASGNPGLWRLDLGARGPAGAEWSFIPTSSSNLDNSGMVAVSSREAWLLREDGTAARDTFGGIVELPALPTEGQALRTDFGVGRLQQSVHGEIVALVYTALGGRASWELLVADSAGFRHAGSLSAISLPRGARAAAFDFAPNGDVLLVGQAGLLARWGGGQWTRLDRRPTDHHLLAAAFAEDEGIAVGGSLLWPADQDEFGPAFGVLLPIEGQGRFGPEVRLTAPQVAAWAAGPRDYWSVGAERNVLNFPRRAWMVHWDGAAAEENSLAEGTELLDVFGVASDRIWAVGAAGAEMLALEYDGTAWKDISPDIEGRLIGLWAASENEVFAVGCSPCQAFVTRRTIMLRYDGRAWVVLDDPILAMPGYLSAVYGFADGTVFVGLSSNDPFDKVLRSDDFGASWRVDGELNLIPFHSTIYARAGFASPIELWGATPNEMVATQGGWVWTNTEGDWRPMRGPRASWWGVTSTGDRAAFVGPGGAIAFGIPPTLTRQRGSLARLVQTELGGNVVDRPALLTNPWRQIGSQGPRAVMSVRPHP